MSNNLPKIREGQDLKKPLDKIVEHEPEGGRYPMKGGPVPKSSQIQMWANEKNISLQVMDSGKDDDQAWATVRAIVTETGQFVESRVILRYRDVEQRKMITQVSKILEKTNRKEGGTPTIKDLSEPLLILDDGRITANYTPFGLMNFMKQMVNYRYTAERTAETMAGRRAEWKILNKEWKDKEESEGEDLEDEASEDNNTNEQTEEEVQSQSNQNQKSTTNHSQEEKQGKPKEEKKETPKKQPVNADTKKEKSTKKEEVKNTDIIDPGNTTEFKDMSPTLLVDTLINEMESKGEEVTKQKLNSILVKHRKSKKITPAKFRFCRDYAFSLEI